MMPASNMKIVTLAAAAERSAGTTASRRRSSPPAPIEDGTLRRRSGRRRHRRSEHQRADAGRRVFDDWAAALKARGIRAIDGRIVGDDNAFDDERLGLGWSWDYLQDGYARRSARCSSTRTSRADRAPGAAAGDAAGVDARRRARASLVNDVMTGAAGIARRDRVRSAGSTAPLDVSGTIAGRTRRRRRATSRSATRRCSSSHVADRRR